MAYCEECESKLDDGVRFCPNCGHAVKASDAAQQVARAVEAIVRDMDAPAVAGETVLSSWEGGGTMPVSPEKAVASVQAVAAAADKLKESHQPSVHSSSQNRGEAAPPVKKSKIPKVLGTVGVLAIIALFALYVVPLFIPQPFDPNVHVPLVEGSSQSASSSTAASATSSSTTSASASAAASSTAASSASASKDSASSSAAASTSSATSSSTGSASAAATSKESASTTSSKGSASSSTTESKSATSSSKTSANSGTSTSTSTKSSASSAASSTKSSASAAAKTDYSTTAKPKLADFNWLTGDAAKGNVPSGAKRIIDLGSVTGGWKGYIVGSDTEYLMNADIQVAQSGVTVAIDWYYVRFGGSGSGKEDSTPNSKFKGTWSGNSLDATGSGRITLAAFWQKDGHQYATGSFMWPDGTLGTIALVRP